MRCTCYCIGSLKDCLKSQRLLTDGFRNQHHHYCWRNTHFLQKNSTFVITTLHVHRLYRNIIIMWCQCISPHRFQSSHVRDNIRRPCEERYGRHSVRLRPSFRLGFRRRASRYRYDIHCRRGERSTVQAAEGTGNRLRGSAIGHSVQVKLLSDTIPRRNIMWA